MTFNPAAARFEELFSQYMSSEDTNTTNSFDDEFLDMIYGDYREDTSSEDNIPDMGIFNLNEPSSPMPLTPTTWNTLNNVFSSDLVLSTPMPAQTPPTLSPTVIPPPSSTSASATAQVQAQNSVQQSLPPSEIVQGGQSSNTIPHSAIPDTIPSSSFFIPTETPIVLAGTTMTPPTSITVPTTSTVQQPTHALSITIPSPQHAHTAPMSFPLAPSSLAENLVETPCILGLSDSDFIQKYSKLSGVAQARTAIMALYAISLQKISLIEERYIDCRCQTEWETTVFHQHFMTLRQHIKQHCNNALNHVIQQKTIVMSQMKKKGKPRKLPDEVTDILSKWFLDHCSNPYPSPKEKEDLMKQTGLTITQLNNWFINKRGRNWKVVRQLGTSTAATSSEKQRNCKS